MQGGGGWGPPGHGGPPPHGGPLHGPAYGHPPAPPQHQAYAPPAGGYGQHGPQAFGPAYGPPAIPGPYGFTTCPRCNSPHVTRPSFTWWGGLVGPKLLNHTVCGSCSFGFNGKTGKSNSTAIGIYLGAGVGLAVLIVILRIAAH
jgi:hypothetical protein